MIFEKCNKILETLTGSSKKLIPYVLTLVLLAGAGLAYAHFGYKPNSFNPSPSVVPQNTSSVLAANTTQPAPAQTSPGLQTPANPAAAPTQETAMAKPGDPLIRGGGGTGVTRLRGGGSGGGSVILSGGAGYQIPAFVQSAAGSQNFSTAAVSASFGSNVKFGNILAVGVEFATGLTLNSVTDNCNTGGSSDSYTIVANPTAGGGNITAMAYAVIGNSGSCTVTATISSASGASALIVHEISGVNPTTPLDNNQFAMQSQSFPGTGTDAITSGNITTVKKGDYIFGITFDSSGNSAVWNAGTGFTNRQTGGVTSKTGQTEDKIQSAAGSTAATFTSTGVNSQYVTGIMAFQPAPI